MAEHLADGRTITCPMGRTGHCGLGVACTVEDSVLEVAGPQSDPKAIATFCTGGRHLECGSFQLFQEIQANQEQAIGLVTRSLEHDEDIDNEILEPYTTKVN